MKETSIDRLALSGFPFSFRISRGTSTGPQVFFRALFSSSTRKAPNKRTDAQTIATVSGREADIKRETARRSGITQGGEREERLERQILV